MLNKTVELLLGVLIFILLAADSDTDLAWNVPDSRAPEETIKARVDTDVLCTVRYKRYLGVHLSFSEFTDLSDGPWCPPLELNFLEPLVKIDGVISGDWLHLALLLSKDPPP